LGVQPKLSGISVKNIVDMIGGKNRTSGCNFG